LQRVPHNSSLQITITTIHLALYAKLIPADIVMVGQSVFLAVYNRAICCMPTRHLAAVIIRLIRKSFRKRQRLTVMSNSSDRLDNVRRKQVSKCIGATAVYGTRATRPLQLWRSWGPSVLGLLQLLQRLPFHWALWELLGRPQTSQLDLVGGSHKPFIGFWQSRKAALNKHTGKS